MVGPLAPGTTYYWSVQSVDSGYRGSAFAEEPAFHTLLRGLEAERRLVTLDEEYRIDAAALGAAVDAVVRELGGHKGLGPSDFREWVPVSRRWLLPILAHLDRVGVTVFDGSERSVPAGQGGAASS